MDASLSDQALEALRALPLDLEALDPRVVDELEARKLIEQRTPHERVGFFTDEGIRWLFNVCLVDAVHGRRWNELRAAERAVLASALDRGGKRGPGSHVSVTVESYDQLQHARRRLAELLSNEEG